MHFRLSGTCLYMSQVLLYFWYLLDKLDQLENLTIYININNVNKTLFEIDYVRKSTF